VVALSKLEKAEKNRANLSAMSAALRIAVCIAPHRRRARRSVDRGTRAQSVQEKTSEVVSKQIARRTLALHFAAWRNVVAKEKGARWLTSTAEQMATEKAKLGNNVRDTTLKYLGRALQVRLAASAPFIAPLHWR
jgi:hypothetical protein